jgi:hypothetical protein
MIADQPIVLSPADRAVLKRLADRRADELKRGNPAVASAQAKLLRAVRDAARRGSIQVSHLDVFVPLLRGDEKYRSATLAQGQAALAGADDLARSEAQLAETRVLLARLEQFTEQGQSR